MRFLWLATVAFALPALAQERDIPTLQAQMESGELSAEALTSYYLPSSR